MSILLFGGEMGFAIPSDGTTTDDGTTGSGVYFDASFARGSLRAHTTSGYWESASLGAAVNALWYAIEYTRGPSAGVGNIYCVVMANSSGTELFRMYDSDGAVQMQYWNGSAWTNIGSAVSVTTNGARQRFDISLTGGGTGSGTAELYISGTSRTSGSANFTSVTNLIKFRGYGLNTVAEARSCNVIVADEPTIGMKIMTCVATGTGSDSAWASGTWASIDEVATSDADFISSASVNQVSTFAATQVSALTGYTVRAVAVTARAKRDASGPQNLQLAVRVSGTNYFSATKALGVGYGAIFNVWETSPATSVAWTVAEMSGLQFGVKSIT